MGEEIKQGAREPESARPKHATFSVSAALFEELGERLVSKPEIALAELIKNAYDADSPTCELTLTDDEVIVADRGHGMTEQEFLGSWMVVSTQKKSAQRFSRKFRRGMAGSKGVGRFSARFLGSVVELTTVAEDPSQPGMSTQLIATFDWRQIAQQQTIGEVTIDYYLTPAQPTDTPGTTLRITQLRDEAKAISTAKVRSDILRLTDPAAGLEEPAFAFKEAKIARSSDRDPGFSVTFHDSAPANADEITPNVAAAILNAFVGRVRIEVTELGLLKYDVFWNRGKSPIATGAFPISEVASAYSPEELKPGLNAEADERGLIKSVAQIPHLPLTDNLHSPVFIDIRFFPLRAGTFSNLGVNGKEAQKWVSRNASLAIVDNSFAMPAYADSDSDWLGIDASKARNKRDWLSVYTPTLFPMSPNAKKDPSLNPMLALPRGTQLIGRIHIATRKRPPDSASDEWLQPNMDRESLRDNGAFRLLWHISRFAVEMLAHFDRSARLEEEDRANKERDRQAHQALASAIEEVKSAPDIAPPHRERIIGHLVEAQERVQEASAYAESSRLSLELMSMMGVMAGFMTHEFEKTLGNLKGAAALLQNFAAASPALAEAAATLNRNEEALANYLAYMRLFISKARDPHPQAFKARGQVSLATKTLGSLALAYGIEIAIDIDPKLPGPLVPLAAYNGIVINLVSNAMKALVPKLSDQPRRIRVFATNDGNRHILVVADNGIGVPEYLRKRIWDPLFTTTGEEDSPLGSGLGLGLSVVNQVVHRLNGRIDLVDKAPPGFITAFRASLPLQPSAR